MTERSSRRGVLLGAGLAAGGAVLGRSAEAQTVAPGNAAALARANTNVVGVISGGVDGTYIRIAADLSAVLDDGDRMRVLPMVGKGSVQNLSDIIYLRGVDIGIVQADVLAFTLQNRALPGVQQAINYITKLYDEEVHVLVRPEIGRVEDLAGKKVNVDGRGSGTSMTASLVFEKLQVAIEPTYDPQSVALKKLREGEIAGLVYVAGRPATLFRSIEADSGLHFVSLPAAPTLLATYLPAQLTNKDYPMLIGADDAVDTLAVGAVMATFGWKPGSDRYVKVAKFAQALSDKFAQLQLPPRHPKWRDVNFAAQVPGWTRFTGRA